MRSGRIKLTRKARFILTHSDTGRVSRKTGLPASYLSRVKKGKIKTVDVKVERKLSRMYDKYWYDKMRDNGVTHVEAEDFIADNTSIDKMERIIQQNIDIAETLVKNRNFRDMNLPKFKMSWHTVNDILEQMRDNESYTSDDEENQKSSWLQYVKRHIVPAVNRGRYYIKPEYRKYRKRRRRK